ncbi:peptidase inhibitor family I36 protein [Kitasatospora sp. NPDC006786]|uniref:peptidase inhibitor family I36 protein n=1 Tax=unclassified Kitasatospora TaxID=2633591 RepID=UPI003373C104
MSHSEDSRAFELLAAMVAGDADISDGIAELGAQGIGSLEECVRVLREGLRASAGDRADALRPSDPLRAHAPAPPEVAARIVHQQPDLPFMFEGELHDPQDIARLNGRELHAVSTPGAGHLLVVDDIAVIEQWWRILFFEQYVHRAGTSRALSAEPQPREFHPRTWFYEDDNLGGGNIFLDANRGYYDLTKVTYFPFADWNDRISSFWMLGTQVTRLWSDIHWSGNSHTFVLPFGTPEFRQMELRSIGFNDISSSLETW